MNTLLSRVPCSLVFGPWSCQCLPEAQRSSSPRFALPRSRVLVTSTDSSATAPAETGADRISNSTSPARLGTRLVFNSRQTVKNRTIRPFRY
eukprot:scaffold447_cov307-Pinguiococcus_pyrenoidosus.AAC.76